MLSIIYCPLSTVHCSRRSPPSGTHTHVDFLSAGYAHSVRSPAVKYGWPAPRTFCRQEPGGLLQWSRVGRRRSVVLTAGLIPSIFRTIVFYFSS